MEYQVLEGPGVVAYEAPVPVVQPPTAAKPVQEYSTLNYN